MAEVNSNEKENSCVSCSKNQKDNEDIEPLQDMEKLKRKASIAQQMLNDIMMQLGKHLSHRKSCKRRHKLTKRRYHHKSSSSSSDTSDNDCQLIELQRCGKELEARLQNDNVIFRKGRHGHKDRRSDRSRSRGHSRGRSRGHSRGRSHGH